MSIELNLINLSEHFTKRRQIDRPNRSQQSIKSRKEKRRRSKKMSDDSKDITVPKGDGKADTWPR
jgi:hypothetical protein